MEEEDKNQYLSPDYSGIDEEEDDDESFDDILEEDDEDEGITESILDNTLKKEENPKMFEESSGSNNQPSSSVWTSSNNSPWTNNNNNSSWPPSNNSPWSNSFGSNKSPWSNNSTLGGTNNGKSEINRNKKFVFCDFLDCLMETYQSNGNPGLLPRDIYDIKPRFNVWSRISAFNPEKVFILFPTNFIPNTNSSNWEYMLTYFTKAFEAFVRSSGNTCNVASIAYSQEQNPKSNVIMECINTLGIKKEDSIYIGVYSGGSGQSNVDLVAANYCGIDYVDLNNLLNNMY